MKNEEWHVARKLLGWPKRCKLAHAFLWEHSYKRLKLAQLLGQLGVLLAPATAHRPLRPHPKASAAALLLARRPPVPARHRPRPAWLRSRRPRLASPCARSVRSPAIRTFWRAPALGRRRAARAEQGVPVSIASPRPDRSGRDAPPQLSTLASRSFLSVRWAAFPASYRLTAHRRTPLQV